MIIYDKLKINSNIVAVSQNKKAETFLVAFDNGIIVEIDPDNLEVFNNWFNTKRQLNIKTVISDYALSYGYYSDYYFGHEYKVFDLSHTTFEQALKDIVDNVKYI